jgi:hypothetical protein
MAELSYLSFPATQQLLLSNDLGRPAQDAHFIIDPSELTDINLAAFVPVLISALQLSANSLAFSYAEAVGQAVMIGVRVIEAPEAWASVDEQLRNVLLSRAVEARAVETQAVIPTAKITAVLPQRKPAAPEPMREAAAVAIFATSPINVAEAAARMLALESALLDVYDAAARLVGVAFHPNATVFAVSTMRAVAPSPAAAVQQLQKAQALPGGVNSAVSVYTPVRPCFVLEVESDLLADITFSGLAVALAPLVGEVTRLISIVARQQSVVALLSYTQASTGEAVDMYSERLDEVSSQLWGLGIMSAMASVTRLSSAPALLTVHMAGIGWPDMTVDALAALEYAFAPSLVRAVRAESDSVALVIEDSGMDGGQIIRTMVDEGVLPQTTTVLQVLADTDLLHTATLAMCLSATTVSGESGA